MGAQRRSHSWLSGRALLAILALLALAAPLVLGWLPQATDDAPQAAPDVSARLLVASLAVAACAATLALALGSLFAAALYAGRVPARALMATLLLVPFVSPPTVWTLAQTSCYGRGGLMERWFTDAWRPAIAALDPGQHAATSLVLAQIHAPLAMLVMLRGLSRLPGSGWDAARLFLPRRRLAGWLVGALRPELLAAWLLSFSLSLGNFAVPHVMQCRLYVIDVYMRSANYLDQLGAVRAALPLVLVTLLAAGGFAWLDRTATYAESAARAPARGRGWAASAGLTAYIVAVIVMPLCGLAGQCRSPGNFLSAVRDSAPETMNTLLIGAAAALAACTAAGVIAPWCVRGNRRLVELVSMAPLGLPPLVIGLAYARTFHAGWFFDVPWIVDTAALAALGLAARGLPFAVRVLASGARGQAPQWDEAARLAGMGLWRRLRWIAGPLWRGPAATAAIVVFVLAAGDIEVSHLLTAPGAGTLAMRLFTFLHFGPVHVTASLALWQLIVVLTPVLVYFLLTDRWLRIV